MLKKLSATFILLFAVMSIAAAGSAPNMEPGLWEITTKMEMPGMAMNMPPLKHTQCLTEKDLIPQNSQPGDACKITETTVTGNTVTWTVECSGQGGEMKGTGKITYTGSSFSGIIKMAMAPSHMEVTSRISGRRTGDCPSSAGE